MERVLDEIDAWLTGADAFGVAGPQMARLAPQGAGSAVQRALALLEALQAAVAAAEPAEVVSLPSAGPSAELSAADAAATMSAAADVIAVPLNDMKSVGMLVKIVDVFGVAAAVPPGTPLPMAAAVAWPAVSGDPAAEPAVEPAALSGLLDALARILARGDNVADLVKIHPMMLDFVSAAASAGHAGRFEGILAPLSTHTLYKYLTILVGAAAARPSLHAELVRALVTLPLRRRDAVKSMLEFLTGFRETGAVSLDRLSQITSALGSVPAGGDIAAFRRAIFGQLFALLGAITTPPEIVQVAVAAIDGLSAPKRGLLRHLVTTPLLEADNSDLETALVALQHLAEFSKNAEYVRELAEPVILPVWLIFVGLSEANQPNASVLALLAKLCDANPAFADRIAQALLTRDYDGVAPQISRIEAGRVRLARVSTPNPAAPGGFELLETRVQLFVALLGKLNGAAVSRVFTTILKRYMLERAAEADPLGVLVDARLVERTAEELRGQLFSEPDEIIDLALGLLVTTATTLARVGATKPERLDVPAAAAESYDSDDEDEAEESTYAESAADLDLAEMCIGLLGGVLLELPTDAPGVKKVEAARPDIVALSKVPTLKSRADYLLELLEQTAQGKVSLGGDEVDMDDPTAVMQLARESLSHPLIPVRAHGLALATQLVARKHLDALPLADAVALFLRELADNDSYIYLNAIRGLETAALAYGANAVLPLLLPAYESPPADVDGALRVGEVLTRVVRVGGRALLPEAARSLVALLLRYMSGRGGADARLRMSAFTLTGVLASEAPFVLSNGDETEAIEAALGVLHSETGAENVIQRRAAVVMLLEVANAAAAGAFVEVRRELVRRAHTQLQASAASDDDELVRDYAQETLTLFQQAGA